MKIAVRALLTRSAAAFGCKIAQAVWPAVDNTNAAGGIAGAAVDLSVLRRFHHRVAPGARRACHPLRRRGPKGSLSRAQVRDLYRGYNLRVRRWL